VAWLALLLLAVRSTGADEHSHKYKVGQALRLWVNKVGPYNNPQETYNYYYLPFCKPTGAGKAAHKWGGLGEVLEGNQLIDSQLDVRYRSDVPKKTICTLPLGQSEVTAFANAVRKHYWYELFIDDLPVWGFVGPPPEETKDDDNIYIYTHKAFDINYNDNRIIQVNLTSEQPKALAPGETLEFTYSVRWVPTATPFSRRFERYLDYNFFEHQIHWFSIFNSFMMVLFLTGLVAMILLRTLKRDYAKYTRQDEDDIEALERDAAEESGWKLVHGDVFRPPRHPELLSALVGTGVQLALLVVLVVLITIAGTLFEERGVILTMIILVYALTSVVGGYSSGSHYARSDGKTWIKTMLLTAAVYPLACFGIGFVLNTIAIFQGSLAAIPFGTMVVMVLLWSCISVPLCLLGTVVGRNWAGLPDNPCRVKRIPSPIPQKQWYLRPWAIALMGGLLPFGSIFIEVYYILTAYWAFKVYYVYGFALLVTLILLIVVVCVSIVGTYFLLNAENYHWQWTAFNTAASTAVYVFIYSIHYFHTKTKMTGFFQTSFYFGYTAMFCLGLGIMCGAVGYIGASTFVRRIYRYIKID
jgi:transmembrane 9 superfamily protein 3